jgi:sigma-B regulation protein RsbU (phosphoserine phosphatase)
MDEIRSFLASIVESSDDAIIGLTRDGRIVSWNSGAERIYGYTREEIRGQAFSRLTLPERADEVVQLLLRIRRGERVRHFETMHLRKNGRVIFVSLTLSPIIDAFGRFLGASAIARDVTPRLRAEEALREVEEKYRLLFSAESDAVILADIEEGTIAGCNDAALKLYGYRQDEFYNMALKNLSADPGESEGGLERVREGTVNRLPLVHHRKKDGSVFAAEVSVGTFSLKGRRMLVEIVRDITERQRSQELRQSLAMAKEIQQHLLPLQAPRLKGFDMFAQSEYCEDIGGDYYDFFRLEDVEEKTLGFAVGDVCGHGIGAALIMAMVKGMLRAETERYKSDLGGLFEALNRKLVMDIEDSSFLTLCYGILNSDNRTLLWNSAGHGPVFWYRSRRGQIRELPTTGIPLGIAEKTAFPPARPMLLDPGDILLIGTDGIWETRNPRGEMFQPHRLRQLLGTWSDKSAEDIYRVIMEKVGAFRMGEHQADDMTLMVIKVLPN